MAKAENKTELLAGGVNQAQIDAWKKEHGKVYQVDIVDPDNPNTTHTCYVKKPTKKSLAAAAAFIQTDPMKAGTLLTNDCYLGGDPECKDKDECSFALNLKVGELFKIPAAEIKEL